MSIIDAFDVFEKKIKEKKIELTKPEIKKSPEKVKAIKKDLKELTKTYNILMEYMKSSAYRKHFELGLIEHARKKGIEKNVELKGQTITTTIQVFKSDKIEFNKIKRDFENYINKDIGDKEVFTFFIWEYNKLKKDFNDSLKK